MTMTNLEIAELVQREGLKIDNMLCFALYSASRLAVDSYRPLLDKFDLTYPQYLALVLLWEREPRTIKEIGSVLYLDSGTLSPLLKRLEKKGLIVRQRDSQDERLVNISLTQAGWDMKEQTKEMPGTLFCQLDWPVEEFASLVEKLHHLTDRLAEEK